MYILSSKLIECLYVCFNKYAFSWVSATAASGLPPETINTLISPLNNNPPLITKTTGGDIFFTINLDGGGEMNYSKRTQKPSTH